ncbi:MAG: putative type VI secretion system effector [Achromobacter sp.]|uniref:putative type VI secretion system effector n=1 Tax=Achromobacter sp. TaxID=134375 RepID=UPI003D0469FE
MMETNFRKLSGHIGELKRSCRTRDFVMSQIGGGVGPAAVSASLAGMGGAAISIATLDTTETADYVEFVLDGKPLRGWFWKFPFSNGDEVEVVAEPSETGPWSALGVRRESDGLVAVYPHCFEGRWSHYFSTFRVWAAIMGFTFIVILIFDLIQAVNRGNFSWSGQASAYAGYFGYMLPGLLGVSVFFTWLAGRKTEGFARFAEVVFRGFGWNNPSKLNLRAISKRKRKPGDGRDYGLRYFRY